MSFKKILVGIDNSQLCNSVFTQALELAHMNQGSLMLLHCLSSETVGEPPVPMSFEMSVYPEMMNAAYEANQVLMQQKTTEARTWLQSYCDTATSQGVPTNFDYQVGNPGHSLCTVARSWDADLIVLGRRGLTGLAEAMLGSVSNYVLHHAPCSVLVIQQG